MYMKRLCLSALCVVCGYSSDRDVVSWHSLSSPLASGNHRHGARNVTHRNLVILDRQERPNRYIRLENQSDKTVNHCHRVYRYGIRFPGS